MRLLFIGILLVSSTLTALGQSATDTCNFLKNLKFKNRRDTIEIKAVLDAMVEAPPPIIYKKTQPGIYKYEFHSQISFKPKNCSGIYTVPTQIA